MNYIELTTSNIKVMVNTSRIMYIRGSVIYFNGGTSLVVNEKFDEIKAKIDG